MILLMAYLPRKLEPFQDDGGSNSKNRSEGNSEYREEKKLQKESEK
jgi:hypothetical protein